MTTPKNAIELTGQDLTIWTTIALHQPTGRRFAFRHVGIGGREALNRTSAACEAADPFGGSWVYGQSAEDFDILIEMFNTDMEPTWEDGAVNLDEPIPFKLPDTEFDADCDFHGCSDDRHFCRRACQRETADTAVLSREEIEELCIGASYKPGHSSNFPF